jgi:saccharopine dehydrogenase (NADP+, L-glutamate forming)
MLPAHLHPLIAHDCIKYRKNMLNASYVSKEMKLLHEKARERGIILLNECGLDPGLDHMTAMKSINEIRKKGGKLIAFKSYTGGLIAPESDDNPWHYKFTWNPRNVVLAGQGSAAKFIMRDLYKYIPYHKLFSRYELIDIDGLGTFEGYPNRDSLSYRDVYGLENIPTMLRGTLRNQGFCSSWDTFVQLGMTDDSYSIQNSESMTNREFTNSFLRYNIKDTVEDKLCDYLKIDKNSENFNRLEWLGLFSDSPLNIKNASPASILQMILEKKWSLKKGDKDMIVMQHLIEYEMDGKIFEVKSSVVSKGDDEIQTAMSKTVGWPLAIAARMILEGVIFDKGVVVPTKEAIYLPVLKELEKMGIMFIVEESQIG